MFSTLGKKIKWMRQNPKVCVQADEIVDRSNWLSVIVYGTFLELRRPQYATQREHAMKQLAQYSEWWINPMTQRGEPTNFQSIEPVYFRIDIESISGLGTMPDAEESARRSAPISGLDASSSSSKKE